MRVLLVDDEALPLEDMRLSLQPAGFNIETTTKPNKALEMYEAEPFDAVVSDVRMPEMSGIELLKRLREIDPNARVIIVTAYGDLETAKEAINNRAYAFFGKPIRFPELIQTLREIDANDTDGKEADLEKLREENTRLKQVYQGLLDEVRGLRENRGG